MEHAPLFWNWLEDGASVYVCGALSAWPRMYTPRCIAS